MSTPQFAIWSQEKFELLVDLWVKKGLTASQCARELGTTRNSVLSKVHRSGIAERTVPRRSGTTYRRKKRPAELGGTQPNGSIPGKHSSSFTVKRVELKVDGLPPEPVSDVPLQLRKKTADIQDDQCRWIYGDTGTRDYHYCHHKQVPGIPYCESHRQRAFETVKVENRKAERDVKMARAKINELA
jgi:GcrA cell cycle regulator